MWVTDPRLALLGAGVAVVASGRVRKVVGRGMGYVASGTMKAGGQVAHAAEDIYDEARYVAGHNGGTHAKPHAKRAAAA